jgi:hypothetical protein
MMMNSNNEMIEYLCDNYKNISKLVKETKVKKWIANNHLEYSKSRYKRLSKGIHTRTTYDDLVYYLVKNGYKGVIDWRQ